MPKEHVIKIMEYLLILYSKFVCLCVKPSCLVQRIRRCFILDTNVIHVLFQNKNVFDEYFKELYQFVERAAEISRSVRDIGLFTIQDRKRGSNNYYE